MIGSELIDSMSGKLCEVSAEPIGCSTEHVACGVESNGDDGNGLGDDP